MTTEAYWRQCEEDAWRARYWRTLESERWQALKWVRLGVAGFRCEKCGWRWAGRTPRDALKWFDLHHVTYIRLGAERVEDVRVLCPDCHAAPS